MGIKKNLRLCADFIKENQLTKATKFAQKVIIEKYAKNVGLVYREIKDLYSNTVKINPQTGSVIPVEQRIEKGVIYKLTYVTHGYE